MAPTKDQKLCKNPPCRLSLGPKGFMGNELKFNQQRCSLSWNVFPNLEIHARTASPRLPKDRTRKVGNNARAGVAGVERWVCC